jgi:hypothetical protein
MIAHGGRYEVVEPRGFDEEKAPDVDGERLYPSGDGGTDAAKE